MPLLFFIKSATSTFWYHSRRLRRLHRGCFCAGFPARVGRELDAARVRAVRHILAAFRWEFCCRSATDECEAIGEPGRGVGSVSWFRQGGNGASLRVRRRGVSRGSEACDTAVLKANARRLWVPRPAHELARGRDG